MIEIPILIWHTWFVDVPQTKITHYTSNELDWCDLPRDGCLGVVIVSATKTGDRHQVWNYNSYDYYFQAKGVNGPIYGCDIQQRETDIIKDINSRYEEVSIIRGIWTDETTMAYVQAEIRKVS